MSKELLEKCRPIIEANTFSERNHIVVEDIEPDCAVTSLEVTPDVYNPNKMVHGGALFTLADVCAGMTARSRGAEYVTQQASVHFLRASGSGKLTATGSVLHRGRKTCLIEVRITSEEGKLLFCGDFTFFCIG